MDYRRTKRSILSIVLIAVTASILSNSIFSGLTLLSNSNSNSNSYSSMLFSRWFPEDNTSMKMITITRAVMKMEMKIKKENQRDPMIVHLEKGMIQVKISV